MNIRRTRYLISKLKNVPQRTIIIVDTFDGKYAYTKRGRRHCQTQIQLLAFVLLFLGKPHP